MGRGPFASVLRLFEKSELPSVLFLFRCEAGVVKKEDDMAALGLGRRQSWSTRGFLQIWSANFFLTPTALAEQLRPAHCLAPVHLPQSSITETRRTRRFRISNPIARCPRLSICSLSLGSPNSSSTPRLYTAVLALHPHKLSVYASPPPELASRTPDHIRHPHVPSP